MPRREYAYQKQSWRLGGFGESSLAPFSTGQIRRFIARWCSQVSPERGIDAETASGNATLLKEAFFGQPRLRELAERPLLLTLMASLHAWRGGTLPEKREQLYAESVDLLLDRWEGARVTRDSEAHRGRHGGTASSPRLDHHASERSRMGESRTGKRRAIVPLGR